VLYGTARACRERYAASGKKAGFANALSEGEGVMSDDPCFEPVKGPPDVAYENYYDAPAVKPFFSIVHLWIGRRKSGLITPPLDPGELHERPRTTNSAGSAVEGAKYEQTLHHLSSEDTFSGEFLLSSARTSTLQIGILLSFIAVLVGLVALGLPSRQQLTGQGMESKVSRTAPSFD
jgi:hypothetical protein